jgi:hypothetical protein
VLKARLKSNDKLEEIWKEAIVSKAPSQRVLGETDQIYVKCHLE